MSDTDVQAETAAAANLVSQFHQDGTELDSLHVGELFRLCAGEIPAAAIERHLSRLRDVQKYLSVFKPAEVRDHLLLLSRLTPDLPVVARVRAAESGGPAALEIVVVGLDGRGVCSAVTGCLAEHGYDILQMEVVTYKRPPEGLGSAPPVEYMISFGVAADSPRGGSADDWTRELCQDLLDAYRRLAQGNRVPAPRTRAIETLTQHTLARVARLSSQFDQLKRAYRLLEAGAREQAKGLAEPVLAADLQMEAYRSLVAQWVCMYLDHAEQASRSTLAEVEAELDRQAGGCVPAGPPLTDRAGRSITRTEMDAREGDAPDTTGRRTDAPLDMEVRVGKPAASPSVVTGAVAAVREQAAAVSRVGAPDGPSGVVGEETAAEAWAAVTRVLAGDPALAQMVADTTVPARPEQRQAVWSCPRCRTGHLHGVGQNRVPGGKRVPGGLLVCGECGYHERRR